MAARREEDIGGGRASWLVPFDVIVHYTKQNARLEKEGEETGRKRERNPPLKSPPGKEREEGRGRKRKAKREGGRGKKKVLTREKNNKKLLTTSQEMIK